jgi:hypothetical protein
MDVAEFEQNILTLAFETDVRITTASVAYYLGISSSEVGPMLDELLERGVLELDSDPEGNLYYRVIDVADREAADEISQLKQDRMNGVDGVAGSEEQSSADGRAGAPGGSGSVLGSATVEDEGGEPAHRPVSGRPRPTGEQGGTDGRTPPARQKTSGSPSGSVGAGPVAGHSPRQASPEDSPVRAEPEQPRPQQQSSARKGRPTMQRERHDGVDELFAGVTSHRSATDASLDSCGDEPVVVQSKVRCSPKPFADSDPTVASCSEQTAQRSTGLARRQNDQSTAIGHVRTSNQQAMTASAGAAAFSREDHLEKPEHQPGMSLLLSLILCGTGQIYNGEVSKGIMMMVLCFLLWFVLLGWVVHIWSIVDSVVVAERINRTSGNN